MRSKQTATFLVCPLWWSVSLPTATTAWSPLASLPSISTSTSHSYTSSPCRVAAPTLLQLASTKLSSFSVRPQIHGNAHVRNAAANDFRSTTTMPPRRAPQRLFQSVEGEFDAASIASSVEEIQAGSWRARLRALYKFTRPHTIRGTILGSIAGTIRALRDTPGVWSRISFFALLPRALLGMMALLLGNAFIVGINQIYDEDIDKLNKPFLPVASGEMSKRNAWVSVLTSLLLGPLLVFKFFPPLLFQLYMMGLFLGGVYSVPPIRTKRSAVLAGLTIATVRGFLLNFGVYYAVKDAVGAPFAWSPKVAFIARFMTLYASVIAITKDLPDVEGDRQYQIETFATKIGVSKIAKIATAFLLLNYVSAIGVGWRSLATSAGIFRPLPMMGGHAVLATLLLGHYRRLDATSMASLKQYYKHIWDLFYLEYGLYTLL